MTREELEDLRIGYLLAFDDDCAAAVKIALDHGPGSPAWDAVELMAILAPASSVDLKLAREAWRRLVGCAFGNRDPSGQPIRGRFSIPVRQEDDDVIIGRALDELETLRAERRTDYAPDEVLALAKWVNANVGYRGVWDHACAECIPTGDLVQPGFQCAVHIARRILAGQNDGNGANHG